MVLFVANLDGADRAVIQAGEDFGTEGIGPAEPDLVNTSAFETRSLLIAIQCQVDRSDECRPDQSPDGDELDEFLFGHVFGALGTIRQHHIAGVG